ncbi:MAG: GNAT family N-acetyltransferase [Vicinamibacterales bacterium]
MPSELSVEVRAIVPADAESAARLSGELGYPADAATMRRRIEQLTASVDHGAFVACQAGHVVGWIHVSAVHHMQSDPRAEIGGLVVAAHARSAGIGAQLVARAEQWASEAGFASVVVRSQIMREAAHRFYLREGYTRTKTSAVFSKPLT